jgi:predicted kinase
MPEETKADWIPIPEDEPLEVPSMSSPGMRKFRRSNAAPDRKEKRGSILRRASNLKRFSELVSTEDFNSSEAPFFAGPYQHIRREMDYSYHRYYRKERQWLQDSIIEDLLDTVDDENVCITPAEPWVVFTAGPRGAGKRHTIAELVMDERLPLLGYVMVDSDEIRRRLPEFDSYALTVAELVDELTHKESGYIAEILTMAAVQEGRNVIVDGTLKHTEWYLNLIEKLKADETLSYKFATFHITAPMDQIVGRIAVSYQL